MAEVKWIKLDSGLFSNRKIRQIEKMPRGDSLIVIWVKLLVLAGKVNDGGMIYVTEGVPYTDQQLATELDRPVSVVKKALEVFRAFGMITDECGFIRVTNWDKYQDLDGLERIREQNRKRAKTFREKRDSNVTRNVTVTLRNGTDKDKDKEKDKDIEAKKDKDIDKALGVPALGDVEMFCQSEGLTVSPYAFWKTFEDREWKQDGVPIRNWKAMIKAWDKAKRTVAGKPDEIIMAVLNQLEVEA